MRTTAHRTQSGLLAGAVALAGMISACAGSQPANESGTDAARPTSRRAADMDRVARSSLRERALQMLTEGTVANEALIRANSIEGLQTAPSRAEDAARAGLNDENAGVRFAAAMTVGMLRLTNSAVFIEPLIDDRDPRVRAAAMFALARLDKSVDLTPL